MPLLDLDLIVLLCVRSVSLGQLRDTSLTRLDLASCILSTDFEMEQPVEIFVSLRWLNLQGCVGVSHEWHERLHRWD